MHTSYCHQFDHVMKFHVVPSCINFGSDFPSILNQTGYADGFYKEASSVPFYYNCNKFCHKLDNVSEGDWYHSYDNCHLLYFEIYVLNHYIYHETYCCVCYSFVQLHQLLQKNLGSNSIKDMLLT